MKKAILLLLSAITMLFACKKEEQKEISKTATYSVYSETGKFTFKCITSSGSWYTEKVNSHNYTKSVEVNDDQLAFISQATSDTVQTTDSLSIKAYVDGKSVSMAYRMKACYKCGGITLGVQLSQAR